MDEVIINSQFQTVRPWMRLTDDERRFIRERIKKEGIFESESYLWGELKSYRGWRQLILAGGIASIDDFPDAYLRRFDDVIAANRRRWASRHVARHA